MPREVQRGGEAEPDGPVNHKKPEKPPGSRRAEEEPADRGQGKTSQPTPGKAEG